MNALLDAPRPRRGFTLIELMVVIGIIGLLAGLLLPAVQASREAARRARCAAHLKGLALAANNFASERGTLPPAWTGELALLPGMKRPVGINSFPAQCLLLPYLEQAATFNAINFNRPASFPLLQDQGGGDQATAASQTIETFLCPSDSRAVGGQIGPDSYRGCLGVFRVVGSPLRSERGAFFANRGVTPAEITDGLSQTIAFSEKPVGSGSLGPYSPFRDWADVNGSDVTGDDWVGLCSRVTLTTPKVFDAGATWMIYGATYTMFNTTLPPNSLIPDCGIDLEKGVFTARSYHPGGVQAAMADGSVRFFTSGTNGAVWRALGTRAGGEVVADPL